MKAKLCLWFRWLMGVAVGGLLFQGGCIQQVQQELEVLFSLESSPFLARNSALVEWFGTGILQLFN
jgi:hypothetical protein